MKKNYSKVKSKCPSAGRVDILTANIKVGVTKSLGVHTWNPASTVLTRTGQFSFLNGQQNCNFVSGPLRLGPEEIMACVTKSKMLAKFCPIYQCCRLHWVTLSTILQTHQMWNSPNVKFHIRLHHFRQLSLVKNPSYIFTREFYYAPHLSKPPSKHTHTKKTSKEFLDKYPCITII